MSLELIILGTVVALPFLYLATLDGNYSVRRSLEIPVPRKQVFDKVRDFSSWPEWSPWLMHEPGTKLEYSDAPADVGGWYTWDGEIVGAGKLMHVSFDGEAGIEQTIEFMRPFKSVCRVWWEFEDKGDSTVVHWNMAGKMPFLLRPMAKKLPNYISKDYETGLIMLQAALVDGAEVPRFSFDGEVELPMTVMLSSHFEGYFDEMTAEMDRCFHEMGDTIKQHEIAVTGPPFTIYSHVDIEHKYFICDMAYPINANEQMDEDDIHVFPGGKFYKVTVRGDYRFLELAWFQAYSHLQMLKKKPRRRKASVEVYENNPASVSDSNDIVTSLYIPVK